MRLLNKKKAATDAAFFVSRKDLCYLDMPFWNIRSIFSFVASQQA